MTYSQTLDTLRGQLHEVEIKTKYNPAIPIMKRVIQNRNANGQFASDFFTYTSYQKMIVTGDIDRDSALLSRALHLTDSLDIDAAPLTKKDSNYVEMVEFFDAHHMFFMETVTKNYFRRPATTYEKVIAHRTAGLKDPIASIFLAKLQKINFYHSDEVSILEGVYVSPLSKGALSIYDFRLEEKTARENDTLFVISFQPKEGAHFKSLTGRLWITSQNYAFTKIEVSPFDKALGFSFDLTQEFEKQSNGVYFLKNMSSRVEFFSIAIGPIRVEVDEASRMKVVLLFEKRITDIDYETRVRHRDIGLVDIEDDLENEATQEKILEAYRPTALTEKESNTLGFMDSLSKEYKFDRRLESLQILITGKVPISFINVDLEQILHFNSVEIARLGLGVYTNDRLSKVVNFGGFFGYGFKDKTWKWGGEIGFNVMRSRDFRIALQYYSNLMESGGTAFFDRDYTLFSGEFYRTWLFQRFYRSHALGVTAQSKLTRWLTGYLSTFYSANKTIFDYSFQQPFVDETPAPYAFDDFHVKVGARLAFKERFWGTGKHYFYSVSPYPVFIIQYTRGFKGMINSNFNYNRIDLKMLYRKNWKILGFTNLTLFAGYIDRPLPAPLLLNQRAGYFPIGLYGADHFGTMRPDEFLSDKYATLFIRHNFGRMTQNKKFSPRIIFCQGIGFGGLRSPESHIGINFKTMEKGYFESGLMIGDLLVIKGLLSFGVGAFVRYGAYYLPKPQYKTIDNFAFKVSFRVPLER
ncbi:MAG: DUF5686 family protein [Lentimicrobiaceae bacterium]|nr:DUF5686 family protein [Lentimicrobiaceae bacterium]